MRRLAVPAVFATLVALLGSCGAPPADRTAMDRAGIDAPAGASPAGAPATGASPASAPGASVPGAARAPLAGAAPTQRYAVGVRTLRLANGAARPLPTTLLYPASGAAGQAPRTDAAPATGHFPVVVFSHGLTGHPVAYTELITRWAAAGFVVAAPAYPHTSFGVVQFDVLDVVNQPADASSVLTAVLALDAAAGDPLRGRLDTSHVAAAGHSAGGITTVGLFTGARDARLSAGIILAGNGLGVGTGYTGAAASLLFVHGDADNVVSYSSGRAAYQSVPWAKAFLTLHRGGHSGPYLYRGDRAFDAVAGTTTEFLRWTLYGDPAAKRRLARAAASVGELESRL